ncbi:MAG TPA: hypothetical protein VFO49_06390 [Nocardioides sp.]|nr:hypothetical protein [Nocardioides sp.]
MPEVLALLDDQCGVVSRRQVIEAGGTDNDIERLIRRREWARVFEGVYVNHTGRLSPVQQDWAAVLLHWPAALDGASALRAAGVRLERQRAAVELVVAESRHPVDPPGVRTRRIVRFSDVALMNLSPPRVRIEHAALTVASEARSDDAAVAVLADVCQRRRTTASRLVAALRGRPRLARRGLLLEILDDVASGAYSALERRYLAHVERPHGLPTARRQRRVRPGRSVAYRDVEYLAQATVVELDGRLGHEHAMDRWADLERDIDAAVAGDLTIRVGWGQVLQPCRLADSVSRLLMSRGWQQGARSCRSRCEIRLAGDSPASGAEHPPASAI